MGTTLKFFTKKLKIKKRNIFIDTLNNYDEIIVVGSGKGVVSVNSIENTKWRKKSIKFYKILLNIYNVEISKSAVYR